MSFRILHLATFLQGGAGRVIVELAREQHREGHDVAVMTSRQGPPGYGNYSQYLHELAAAGITPHLVDSMFDRSHSGNLAAVTALDRLYRHEPPPAVIHAHAAIPSLVGLMFAGLRREPIKLVQTMHGWGQVKKPDQVATDVSVLNLVDRVAVPSQHSADTLCALGVSPARITVVPYGVRANQPPLGSQDAEIHRLMMRARLAGRLVIACVGTFGPRKNQVLLVDAIARLSDIDLLCLFIGDGDATELRAAIAARGCGDRVLVHGYSAAARTMAAAASVLVLPSRSEGQPIAVLEAFADNLLVVTSDIPELAELVNDQVTGFTFRSESAPALAQTLARVATMNAAYRRSITDAARSRYTTRFTFDQMIANYSRFYSGVRHTTRSSAT